MTDGAFRYNVDGRFLIEANEPIGDDPTCRTVKALTADVRIELLRYRSLVRGQHAETEDLWPFHDRHVELRTSARER
ncbi:MAG: hypothetical protein WKG00_37780 [Polyangiaceae bacterium]